MRNNEINSKNEDARKHDLLDSLPQSSIPWKRSREEVWSKLADSIGEKHEARKVSLSSNIYRLSTAAIIIILLASAAFMRLYTRTINSKTGELANLNLPDGSAVTLNAETELKYRPMWWRFSREISLEGEAYFEVEKGSTFTVVSDPGKTSVLGTTFNIYSRDGEYEVTCHTGKVRVESTLTGNEKILESNQRASLDEKGKLKISEELPGTISMDWRNGYFRFTSASVQRVFDEISRQYNIIIEGADELNLLYTGNFRKDQPAGEVLNLVCKAFGIDFVKEGENTFRVIIDEE